MRLELKLDAYWQKMTRKAKIKGSLVKFSAAGLLTVALAGQAYAQETRDGRWFAGVNAAGAFQASANLENGTGSFSVGRSFLRTSVGYALDRRNKVALSLGTGVSIYDFDRAPFLGSTIPWRRIHDLRLDLPLSFSVTDRITGFLVPGVRWNTEAGAAFDEGRTQGVRTGFSYRFNDSFSVGPGIGWFTSLGGGSNLFPILLIDWDITDALNVSTGSGVAASQGPGLTISYRLNDEVTIGISGRSESSKFRLDRSGPAPNGIGKDKGFPLLATFEYRPTAMLRVAAFAGAKLGGELKLEDRGGGELATTDYDLAPIFGLSVNARF